MPVFNGKSLMLDRRPASVVYIPMRAVKVQGHTGRAIGFTVIGKKIFLVQMTFI